MSAPGFGVIGACTGFMLRYFSNAACPCWDRAAACERRSHSSKPMRPRRALPNGTSECSSTRPPQYRASGSLTTSRGSPTASAASKARLDHAAGIGRVVAMTNSPALSTL
jgi:hypothetical protein